MDKQTKRPEQSPDTDLHAYRYLTEDQGALQRSAERMNLLNQSFGPNEYPNRKSELQFLPHIMFFLKINSRWTVNLNVSGRTTKFLENNIEYLHDLQVGINKTTNKVGYVKIKNICSSKKIIKGENN